MENSILFICANLKSGGIERQMLETARTLKDRGNKVTILLLHDIIHYPVRDEFEFKPCSDRY